MKQCNKVKRTEDSCSRGRIRSGEAVHTPGRSGVVKANLGSGYQGTMITDPVTMICGKEVEVGTMWACVWEMIRETFCSASFVLGRVLSRW